MRNLIATNIFVRHTGQVSFVKSAYRARSAAREKLTKRHPKFEVNVALHKIIDPVFPARRNLDIARLANAAGGAQPVLFVTHSRGGGVERHIRDSVETLRNRGTGAILLRSVQGRPDKLMLNTVDELHLPNLNPVSRDGGVDGLANILRSAGVSHIQIHSLVDYPQDAVRQIPAVAAALGVPYEFMVHDYLAVCPRINLIDRSGIYCGEKGEDACRICLTRDQSPFGSPDIVDWRADYAALLSGAAAVVAPSRDAARRIEQYFPGVAITVRPHEERIGPPAGYRPPVRRPGEPLRVAVIGAIGPPKGSRVLLDCARDAVWRKLPLEFVIIGYSDISKLETLPNVTVTGRYKEAEVFDLIERHNCHIAFLPSVSPETYSYSLSIAQIAGLPVLAFDLGATPERHAKVGDGVLLPISIVHDSGGINDKLLASVTFYEAVEGLPSTQATKKGN